MKKTLEDELMGLAHRILQLRGREDIEELKNKAGELHEKLSVLAFAEKYFAGPKPNIGMSEVENALFEKGIFSTDIEITTEEIEEIEEENTVTETEEVENSTGVPVIEEKSEIFSEPEVAEEEPADDWTEAEEDITPEVDLREISVHFDELPMFEPVTQQAIEFEEKADSAEDESHETDLFSSEDKPKSRNESISPKKSLNQSLNHGLKFSLNDKITFTNHLFAGSSTDFERVISQLNTFQKYSEARDFIEEHIKPDYDWDEKEMYEERFLQVLETKMDN